MKSLHGQAAIITGGSTEVAGAVAVALAREGVKVSLCGRAPDLLELTASSIRSFGGICLPIVSKLDSLEGAESVAAGTKAAFGRLDIVILVSGFWSGGFLHEHSVKAWDLVMSANLREPFLMARAALPFYAHRAMAKSWQSALIPRLPIINKTARTAWRCTD
jgi:NAD(P)-dependent dehydrogenase (short-subunit alcohol dehydrogenase family)